LQLVYVNVKERYVIFIPPHRGWINHNIWWPITGRNPIIHKMDTRFFSRCSHACRHANPRCVDLHLVVQRLIGNPKPSSPRALQEPTTSEIAQWHEQFTRVAFDAPPGKATTPLTNHREVAKNKHHSCHNSSAASKPSRWRQPPRETRIPQPMLTQVLTRYKLTSKYTWDHSISLWFVNQVREMSGREYAQLKRMSKCPRALPLSQPISIYRCP
jgi:hypothetical protein